MTREASLLRFGGGSAEDMVLFEKLRQLRITVAKGMGVPPYIVFSDRTLHELATVKPETVTAIGGITGIGTHKREQFGATFVKAIREHKGLSSDESESWCKMEFLPFDDALPFPQASRNKKSTDNSLW